MEFLTIYWWRLLLVAVISYLLGSFSFAIIFTKLSKNQDVRTMGSGNAGFTNVLRSVGVVPAVFTFIFDCLKGVIAVIIAWALFTQIPDAAIDGLSDSLRFEYLAYGKYLAGMFCVLGHSFPVFFGFKGGKGVTTMAGILLILDWRLLALTLAVFLIFFLCTKIISVGSLACTVAIVVWNFVITFFLQYLPSQETSDPYRLSYVLVTTGVMLLIGVFVAVLHRENIKRLIRGEEKKITAKKN
ncbi:MAG: glycerol-3-phosphate 1-O-acyltransferase PlsY [Clostridia bacterium]|nr:glycerol-3-phosphate 1-O-acyltransferase PlsY [Clostridia bacterium]